MHKFLPALLVALLSTGTTAPVAAEPIMAGEEHCVVNVRADDRLNLRAGPGTESRVLNRLAYGSCGIIATGACKGSWCRVEDGHYAGWVHRRYIAALPGAEFCFTASARREMRALRAWPAPHSRVQARLPDGQCEIQPLPYQVEGWQKVRVAGYEGWLPKAALTHIGD